MNKYSGHFSENVKHITHHLCHASAAMIMSPFEKALIVVIDGAGSNALDFSENHAEKSFVPQAIDVDGYLEESSVYSINHGKLNCLEKNWQKFVKNDRAVGHSFSDGLGSLYEKTAEYIFNDKRAAGKVMGLAAFGRPFEIIKRSVFLERLDWTLAFNGSSKNQWESSKHFNTYANIAASVQNHFENSVMNLVKELQKKYSEYENLILVGGCALNCTTNMKLVNSGLFKSIYIPPFPGDESIGLGAASYLYHYVKKNPFQVRPWQKQVSYFGAQRSVPTEEEIRKEFEGAEGLEIIKPQSIEVFVAEQLAQFKILGWCQGRSETGPRALGNRSILARVDRSGLKNRLNSEIKMRENFRPYGCSILHEEAHKYFDIPEGFENPFMSFAVKTRPEYLQTLHEVTH
ncbi:MAG: carbamoyltransferase C-terminal domain-containing protein, partial [Bdellovibrionales bacterium]